MRFPSRLSWCLLSLTLAGAWATHAYGEPGRSLKETGDTTHFALMGEGFLLAIDEQETRYLIRSGVLVQNNTGRLCCQVGDKFLMLDPVITVPHDAFRLQIAIDGTVAANLPGHPASPLMIGSLQAAIVRHREGMRQISPAVWKCTESPVPTMKNLGEASEVYFWQGWIEPAVLKAHKKADRSEKPKRSAG